MRPILRVIFTLCALPGNPEKKIAEGSGSGLQRLFQPEFQVLPFSSAGKDRPPAVLHVVVSEQRVNYPVVLWTW